jgi:hypothetical protein
LELDRLVLDRPEDLIREFVMNSCKRTPPSWLFSWDKAGMTQNGMRHHKQRPRIMAKTLLSRKITQTLTLPS